MIPICGSDIETVRIHDRYADQINDLLSNLQDDTTKRMAQLIDELTERAEAAEARAAELQAQLDAEKDMMITILSERNNLEHKFAAMTTDRDSLIAQLAEVQSAHQRLIADNSQLRHDLKESVHRAGSVARIALNDRLETAKLIDWLAEARIEIARLKAYNAALNLRWADTRPTPPTIGDSIRAIWKRHDGNVTGATLEVMDYMREHGNRITLDDAQRLLRIHVPELTSAEELAE